MTGTLLTWRPDWAGRQFLLRRPRVETTGALRVPSTPALEGGSGLESGSEQSLCGEGSGVTTSPAFHWGPQIPVGKGAGETASPAQDPRTTKPSVVSEVVKRQGC